MKSRRYVKGTDTLAIQVTCLVKLLKGEDHSRQIQKKLWYEKYRATMDKKKKAA